MAGEAEGSSSGSSYKEHESSFKKYASPEELD
jgi:hypothetical protein